MKNVHVIPTEKASKGKLVKGKNLHFYKDGLSKEFLDIDEEFQHIYITDDSEIKEGDWCLGMDGIFQYKGKVNLPDVELPKKIILTTDQDLIADGVQAIDDEFLEWFVRNPSCEYVKTDLVPVNEFGSEITVNSYGFDKFKYKIIIPQEEPKQETLEEFIEEELEGYDEIDFSTYERFIKLGAKWQAEQQNLRLKHTEALLANCEKALDKAIKKSKTMYSEEEVRELLLMQRGNSYIAILTKTKDKELAAIASTAPEPGGKDGWVKQIKKK